MGWWKADPGVETPETATKASQIPAAPHPISSEADPAACPIDPKTRQIWLQAAQQKSQTTETATTDLRHGSKTSRSSTPSLRGASEECSSDRIDQPQSAPTQPFKNGRSLSSEREVSTIPRAYIAPLAGASPAPSSRRSPAPPSNSESETGHDKVSGNWIYPSESQFFNAVLRKSSTTTSPQELASSVSAIIPIHNAVNERAWHQIKLWEGSHPSNRTCGGPKLLRFEGKGAGAKSPRAIMKSWSGYQEPFDRHDWTIQRCDGTQVEYVIDFYQGRSPAGQTTPTGKQSVAGMGGINFYLDVRPKLNSWEGCRLRIEKVFWGKER